MSNPKYPNAKAKLTKTDSNIFSLIARASKALRDAGVDQSEIEGFAEEVMDTGSYDEALQTIMRWVKVS